MRGDASERIALEHPADPPKAIGVVELREGALCASASNRRSWGDGLHHVIDAVTGIPTADVIATWALAPDALHADGLATALFFDPLRTFSRAATCSTSECSPTGAWSTSPSFPGEVFA